MDLPSRHELFDGLITAAARRPKLQKLFDEFSEAVQARLTNNEHLPGITVERRAERLLALRFLDREVLMLLRLETARGTVIASDVSDDCDTSVELFRFRFNGAGDTDIAPRKD